MFFYVMTGYSEVSAEDALEAAVGDAVQGYGEEAESVHIIILGVVKVGDGWRALVRVVVEPKVKEPKEKAARDDEENKKKLKQKEHGEIHPDQPHPVIHFHVMDELEVVLGAALSELGLEGDDYYLHVMAEGPLWLNVQGQFPDIDFYEAVHSEEIEMHPEDIRPLLEQERVMLRQWRAPTDIL